MLDVKNYLDSFLNWEPRLDSVNADGVSSFSLEAMEELLVAFGRPDDQLKFVHIAGTKGKGSSSIFLAYLLRACGYRVGLYTSPHFYDVRERMRVLEPNRHSDDVFEGMITQAEFEQRVKFYQKPVDDLRKQGASITWFEYITALALSWFAKKKVQIVILETGLGGRLDATNIVETSVCGITPIGLEHTDILGNTLSLIAQEKAAIIRSANQRVILAEQKPEAMSVLEKRCQMFGIHPDRVGQDVTFDIIQQNLTGTIFSVTGRRGYQNLQTSLLGEHQVANATFAIALAEALETFGFYLTPETVQKGIADAQWPGRFEILHQHPLWIVDGAHTVESAHFCVKTLMTMFPNRKYILLFGASQDKNIEGILKELVVGAQAIIFTHANHPRAMTFHSQNFAFIEHQASTIVADSVSDAIQKAQDIAKKDDIILATGSIFLVGEVRAGLHLQMTRRGQ